LPDCFSKHVKEQFFLFSRVLRIWFFFFPEKWHAIIIFWEIVFLLIICSLNLKVIFNKSYIHGKEVRIPVFKGKTGWGNEQQKWLQLFCL